MATTARCSIALAGLVSCLGLTVQGAPITGAPALGDLRKVGAVDFPTSCAAEVRVDFARAVALLHSFFYEEARRLFTEVARRDPGCGIAHWGVAMTWVHPLWSPPSDDELKLGQEAVAAARTTGAGSARERELITAIAAYYGEPAGAGAAGAAAVGQGCHGPSGGHPARARAYADAMERVHQRYPRDVEATAFYALALLGAASPVDPTLATQLAAASLLEDLWKRRRNRNHPGLAHYLIHAYDYPSVAARGLDAAKSYAAIAPWVPHALHMPSHIFTRLGMWDESIRTNLASAEASRDYAARFHPGAAAFEELHAMDYLVYAYLQIGDEARARQIVDQVASVKQTHPANDFVAAYAVGAIPARYALERHAWREAATLPVPVASFWAHFPFAEAHLEFAHALGRARSGDLPGARQALDRLQQLRDATTDPRHRYFARHLDVQRQAASAWVARAEGNDARALELLRQAADAEDALGKHPVSPGAIFPVRELLGELLLDLGRPAEARVAYEASLKIYPGRRTGLRGLARSQALLAQAPPAAP